MSEDPTLSSFSSSTFADASCDAPRSSKLCDSDSSFAKLSSDFLKHYGQTMANVEARLENRRCEDAVRSEEEAAQAAFAWLWERIHRGDEIRSIQSLFKKSCLVSQRTKAIRRLRRDWLLKQRAHIMFSDGGFAPPANGEETQIGVGRSLGAAWQDTLQERAHEVSVAFEALREARLALSAQERDLLDALCSGVDGREAALILGVTENNFRQRVFRLRRKLVKLLRK